MEPRADQTAEILERLRTGAAGHACAGFLTTLDPLHLADLLTGLVYDRLRRKYDAAAEIYRISGQNWNQTFYTLLFRYIGDLSNQDTYTELARRATYTMVLRERRSLSRIEALLFGTSGLLDTFRPDDYIRRLRDDFAYFRARYDIEPIDPSAWKTANIRPGNLPRLRIAQLASFFSQHDFVFEQLLACRTRQEVNRLFRTEASPYWSGARHTPEGPEENPKRVGQHKTDVFGINVVSILQYVYGSYIQNEELRDRAIALLECIPAEENKYTRPWIAAGVNPRNAFDTQGLIQLSREYCAAQRCECCPVARRIIDKITRSQ